VKRLVALVVMYVGLAVLANWLAARYVWPVGFGYEAPGGVFAIGAVLVTRDWINQLAPRLSLALIPVASAISYGIGQAAGWTALQKIALASVAAFCISESVEFLVFAPLRRRSLTLGVALSGSVGIALDSYVFLSIAFGSLAFFDGQMIGKAEALAAGVLLTAARRAAFPVLQSS
jgi:queuosine precursor transporter